ncbi:MAG TPA: hypothetical protein VHN98_01210 [Acidimicrobiales bacterium]|nr:hypothetical protein [Acidimicrobiales bacterium]
MAIPAGAQTNVGVTLTNPSSSRTLYVEDMAGQPLNTLAFGTNRSLPFRVRVVDNAFSRQQFTVNASMTNLYVDNGGNPDPAQPSIPSSQVSLGSQATPLNILNVAAQVQPLVDTVSTITDTTICSVLGVALAPVNGTNACQLTTSGLTGTVQDLTVPINLSNLTNLPLLPQANETGNFPWAEYGAGTAGATDTAGKNAETAASQTPTQRRMISGQPVSDATVLSALDTVLGAVPQSSLVPTATVVSALQSTYSTTWGLLSQAQITTILANTLATAQALVPGQILSQTGTYMSLPTLNVDTTGAAAGDYLGTLVVTALQ